MLKVLIRIFVYVAIAGIIVGGYASLNPDAFAHVPDGRDPGVVGDWYSGRRTFFRHYHFNEDGTGQLWMGGREPRDFVWGTDGARLQMKYRTNYGWTAPKFDFNFKDGGEALSLHGLGVADSSELTRSTPSSVSLD